MKQVLVRGGKVEVHELPVPTAPAGSALVRVHCSMISSGTESSFVSEGGVASYAMKKAKDPLNIEKVKRKLATIGLKGTLDIVRNKLFEFQTPGYSAAGTIIECGDGLQGYRSGDRVACAGVGHASHA
ncbi:MAG TPA: oxidoreductase, partial [Candidatus Hydrogenedentes bacterium]|nr:oxidoreductase [Candidatus Hydrogenedentota bacterium]